MKKLLSILFLGACCMLAYSQTSPGFNYQGVVRNSDGSVVAGQNVNFRLSILNSESAAVYTETHTAATGPLGLVELVIGTGSVVSGSFSDIDWSTGGYSLKVEMDPAGGTSYTLSETRPLQWVPYAKHSEKTAGIAGGKLEIMGDANQNDEEALFEVKRNDGQTVFAVYPDGVRVYVEDPPGKGSKGGFAVGGFDPTKGLTSEFLRVTPDSVRIYVAGEDDKGPKGGFAVGGFNPVKGAGDEFLRVTPDSVRIYIEEGGGKGPKGGFAVGGFNPVKGLTSDYFNVSGKSDAETYAGEPRVLWYPKKEAFLAGNVLVQHPDSVGTNSWASGYQSKAIGDWSQALGYQAIARGDYSTAIGKNAVAYDINSFAFGEGASAKDEESYAFGRGAIAEGFRSFAFGSAGIDSLGQTTGVAYAKGDYSFAIGQGSKAFGFGSFAMGLATEAANKYSMALGYKTYASGYGSTALGREAMASGSGSISIGYKTSATGVQSTAIGILASATGGGSAAYGYLAKSSGTHSNAIGWNADASADMSTALGTGAKAKGYSSISIGAGNTASGDWSTSMGNATEALGMYSTSMGVQTQALSSYETVIGRYNTLYTPGSSTGWNTNDRLFVIGNGTGSGSRSNAMTVLKTGRIGLQSVTAPTYALQLPNSTTNGIGRAQANAWVTYSDGRVKTDKLDLDYGLSEVLLLKPIKYYHHNSDFVNNQIVMYEEGLIDIGLVAQEVFHVIPEIVCKPENEDTDLWSMSYEKLVPVLIKAIQEQQQIIGNQQKQFEELKEQLEWLKAMMQAKQ